jgi:hypothetical protein
LDTRARGYTCADSVQEDEHRRGGVQPAAGEGQGGRLRREQAAQDAAGRPAARERRRAHRQQGRLVVQVALREMIINGQRACGVLAVLTSLSVYILCQAQ